VARALCFNATGNGSNICNYAANGYGAHSPGQYSMFAAIVCECVMTFIFLIVLPGTPDKDEPKGFARLAIGLSLTLIHLISIPTTHTSVNPVSNISQALFVSGRALSQL